MFMSKIETVSKTKDNRAHLGDLEDKDRTDSPDSSLSYFVKNVVPRGC